ncbi:MAG: hypothetical protein AAGF87_15160 [Bacteroidota bacterium]
MNKTLKAISLIILCSGIAQTTLYAQVAELFRVEVALPGNFYEGDDKMLVPPVMLSYEKAILDEGVAVVGGSVGYTSGSSLKYQFQGDTYRYVSRYALIRLYGTYYYQFEDIERLRLSGTVGLLASFGQRNYSGTGSLENYNIEVPSIPFRISPFVGVGGHYALSERIEGFLQFSLGSFPVAAGFSYILKFD